MHPKQIENLINLSEKERVDYLIRHCADFEEIWGIVIEKDKWIIFKDSEGDEIFPLWPHKELAEKCAFEEHKKMGAKPQSMSIYSFIEECIDNPDLSKVYFGIFYNLKREAIVLTGENLKQELTKELEQFE